MATKAELEAELIEEIGAFAQDPLGFVLFAFPWGDGELAKFTGPDEWQIEILTQLGEGLITLTEAIQIAIASGHGIGKSAFVAWLILWAICTRGRFDAAHGERQSARGSTVQARCGGARDATGAASRRTGTGC